MLLVVLIAVGTFAAAASPTRSQEAFDTGPVVALGGGNSHRVLAAQQLLAADTPNDRLLVISYASPEQLQAIDRSCEEPTVRCIWPEPATTYGEARAIAQLATAEDWPNVTVVTSDWHVPRTRWLLDRCVHVPFRVVGAHDESPTDDRRRIVVREIAAWTRSAVLHRSC